MSTSKKTTVELQHGITVSAYFTEDGGVIEFENLAFGSAEMKKEAVVIDGRRSPAFDEWFGRFIDDPELLRKEGEEAAQKMALYDLHFAWLGAGAEEEVEP